MKYKKGWILLALMFSAGAASAEPVVLDQEGPVRTLEVEGAAVITDADLPSARQRAIQQALREAVERSVGVYVNADLRTRNSVTLEDRVYTRASGFAVLDAVLDERRDGSTYWVKIRARVRLKPLVEEIRTSEIARPWRVAVVLPATSNDAAPPLLAAETEIQNRLQNAGFIIVPWRQDNSAADPGPKEAEPAQLAAWGRKHNADLVAFGHIVAKARPGMNVPRGWLPVDYTRCSAVGTMRVVRADTAEVLSLLMFSEDSEDTSRAGAIRLAATRIGRRLGDRATADLLPLPGARSKTLQLLVSGFMQTGEAWRFEKALEQVPGVRRVIRQQYIGGKLLLDVLISVDTADRLTTFLEDLPVFYDFRIQVDSEQSGRISAHLASPS